MRIKRGHAFSQSLASSKQATNKTLIIVIAITPTDTEIQKGGVPVPSEGAEMVLAFRDPSFCFALRSEWGACLSSWASLLKPWVAASVLSRSGDLGVFNAFRQRA